MKFDLQHTQDILERSPRAFRGWLEEAPEAWLTASEGPGKWTPHDIIGHLLHCEEEDWMPRTRILLEEGEARTFDPFDPEGFRERYGGLDTAARLKRFEGKRRENLTAVRELGLTDELLDRTGTHPVFGRVTLRELLATWTVHDLTHQAQMARVMCRAYGGNVGPWREFLPILQP